MVTIKSQRSLRKPSPKSYEPDYPLQGSPLDIPLSEVLSYTDTKRNRYINRLLTAFSRVIEKNEMALKTRVPFAKEMRDLRRLLKLPPDAYLFLDEKNYKRDVLGKGSPGATHTYWSRKFMWRMATGQGDLAKDIKTKSPSLVSKLDKFFDGNNSGKTNLRNPQNTAVKECLKYLQLDRSVGSAFPPFHAKFLADRFLPQDQDCLIVDPCAGWGGRLLGTLCVNRTNLVHYVGIDPEKRNKDAYEGILRRLTIYLKKELAGSRSADFYYKPFEDWIKSASAKKFYGKTDLVLTSPPYFAAEVYNTENKRQSANRYRTYDDWRENFYRVLVQGAFDLLRPGGAFVLNIANVASSKYLERDARVIARDIGFKNAGFLKLAMSITPGTRTGIRHTVSVDGTTFKHEPVFCFKKPA